MDSKIIEIETKVIKVEIPDYKSQVDDLMTAINMHDDEVKRINKKVEITGKSMIDQIATYLIELFEPFMNDDGTFKMQILHFFPVRTWKGDATWYVEFGKVGNFDDVTMKFCGREFEKVTYGGYGYTISKDKLLEFYSSMAKEWDINKKRINGQIKTHFELYGDNKHQFFERENEYEKDIDNFRI